MFLINLRNPLILNAKDAPPKTPHNHANSPYHTHKAVPSKASSSKIQSNSNHFHKDKKSSPPSAVLPDKQIYFSNSRLTAFSVWLLRGHLTCLRTCIKSIEGLAVSNCSSVCVYQKMVG